MVLDKEGNLYGSGQSGTGSSGAIFELKKSSSGAWSEGIIHTFTTSEGSPNGDLTWDDSGNLYGTTSLDSTGFNGEVFELTPQSNSSWKKPSSSHFPPRWGRHSMRGCHVRWQREPLRPNLFWHWRRKHLWRDLRTFAAIERSVEIYPHPQFYRQRWRIAYSRLVFDSNGNLYGTGLYTDNNPCSAKCSN